MPRALSMRQSSVPVTEREHFRASARKTLAHYAAEGCSYWLFEAQERDGDYVEFFEAPDTEKLMRAHQRAPDGGPAAAPPLYVHVELN